MAAGDLTTLANAQAWCVSTDNVLLPRLISAISASIQNWLGYNVISASYTHTLDGNDRPRLYLPQVPITAVTSLVIGQAIISPSPAYGQGGFVVDNNCRFPGAPAGSGLSISLRPGAFGFSGLAGYNYFWEGQQNVFVTYTAGFPSTPPDLEQACLYWLKIVLADAGPGVNPVLSVLKAGSTSFTYTGRSQVSDPKMIPIPPVVLALLEPYKLVIQTA